MDTTHAQHHFSPRSAPARDYGRILLGLVVVAIGIVYLLEGAGVVDASHVVADYWPAVIVATALFQIAEGTHGRIEPAVLLVAGSVLLLVTLGVITGNVWDYVWPTAIIVAGIFIITRWRGIGSVEPAASQDVVVASGIFGGPSLVNDSPSFRGGSLTAVFGGVTLDLRGAHPAADGASITATAAFGGVEILVPRDWRVAVKATPIFGGIEDKTDHVAAPDAPALTVDGLALFGGIELKHEK